MKAVLSVFKQRWVVSLFGLLALAFLIWFAGPLFGFAGRQPLESELNRQILIAVLFAAWGLVRLRAFLVARRTNSQMLAGIASEPVGAPSPEDLRSAEEIATLKQRLDEAVGILKKTKLRNARGRQHLYQLPWYIIIGPPGAGKTTALVNSGLRFPLADRLGVDAIRGVGGTRNCDWWFTDDAVLLDTAGRYTTQDSHEQVDHAAWTGFLDLLRKYRRRRPVNGVLVAISLPELMEQTEAERVRHARAIRQRIEELHEHFRIRFPIYVLFTKCDLLAGFTEFFSDLGREERAQVWGMTFPVESAEQQEGALGHLAAGFATLERGLHARLSERLYQERDLERRSLIYRFPKQFSSLKEATERFLSEAFQPSRFLEKPMIRGVYFTSATQEGTPIDRLMGSLASAFGLERQVLPSFSGTGRSYFITRLFRDLIFQEAELAGTNLRLERQRVWLQRGAYAATIGVVLLAAVAWFISYVRNSAYVTDVANRAQVAQEVVDNVDTPRYLIDTLPGLAAARSIPTGDFDAKRSAPLLMGLGLYQGDKLDTEANAAYRRLLVNLFLPTLMLRVEDRMRQLNRHELYDALKVYLMLGSPQHFDGETIERWIKNDWNENLPRTVAPEQRRQLDAHLVALLEKPPASLPIRLDADLVERTREVLNRVPLPERVYAEFKRKAATRNIPGFRIDEAAGRDALLVFARASGEPLTAGVSGLYTYTGYHEVFAKEIIGVVQRVANEGWVLGREGEVTEGVATKDLILQVEELYLQDYASHWNELLADINIVPFTSLTQAVDVLNVLSGESSPLRRLLEGVVHETALDRSSTLASTLAGKAGEGLSAIKGFFRSDDESERGPLPSSNYVARRFAPLKDEVVAAGDAPPSIARTLSLIEELYVHVDAVAAAAARGQILDVAKNQAGTVIERLEREARRKPPPLSRWLLRLANQSQAVIGISVRGDLNRTWSASVLPFCRRAIEGRYPIVRDSTQEITLEDFGRFFGPGGIMEEFFQEHLTAFVDTSRREWTVRASQDASPRVSTAGLRAFQRASVIRNAFFSAGGQQPAVRFQLQPIGMDAKIRHFSLDVEGQQLTYAHGPVRPTALRWPNPDGPRQVRIQISPPAADGRSTVAESGPWAWFKILDRSSVVPTSSPEQFQVTFEVGGHKARYELRASSAFNPFGLKELDRFSCPDRL